MALGDILSGFAAAGHQHYQNLLQMEYNNRNALADQYSKLAQDPNYSEDQQAEFLKRAIGLHTLPPGKKTPKEWENFTITVQPPTPPAIKVHQGAGVQASPVPTGLGPMLPGTSASTLDQPIAERTIQPPAPMPRTENLLLPIPFEKQLERTRQLEGVKASVQSAIAKAGQWKKRSQYDMGGPDGKRYHVDIMDRYNPDTGAMETQEFVAGNPRASYAPRMGEAITAGAARAYRNAGLFSFKNAAGEDIDLDKLIQASPEGEDTILRNKGEDRYDPESPRRQRVTADNIVGFISPYAPRPITPDNAVGVAVPEKQSTTPRAAGVDAYGRQLFLPLTTRTTVATNLMAPPPAPPPGLNAAPTPAAAVTPVPQSTVTPQLPSPPPPKKPTPAAQQTAPQPQGNARPAADRNGQPFIVDGQPFIVGGLNPFSQRQQSQIMLAVKPAAQILYGDPDHPDFESLSAFGDIADNREAADRVGRAVRTILNQVADVNTDAPPALVGKLMGDTLAKMASNYLGITKGATSSEVAAMHQALDPLGAREGRMVARIMAAYGTIVGLRRFTGGSALEFATQIMEKELPIPGVAGVTDSRTYYSKLAQLAEEITAATSQLAPEMVPLAPFYGRQAKVLNQLGLGYGVAEQPDGTLWIKRTPQSPWERLP